MTGAESLIRTLIASGVEICFANPGTTEMQFVVALDKVEGMRCVLGMAEAVVTGCADGYARMAEKPAMTLLHCGPGFANGIANLHNARRANSPMVNIVGDQATYHRPFDPPLTADTEGLARSVSHWVRTSGSAQQVAIRRRRGGSGCAHPSGPDRNADRAGRCRLGRGKRPGCAACSSTAAAGGAGGPPDGGADPPFGRTSHLIPQRAGPE